MRARAQVGSSWRRKEGRGRGETSRRLRGGRFEEIRSATARGGQWEQQMNLQA